MFSIRQLIRLSTLIFGLLSTVTSSPLEKRLDSGTNQTGGSAAVQYTDPKTKVLWIKNYHVRKSDGFLVEAAFRSDTGSWTLTDLGSSVTGDQDGGLAALAFIREADNIPVIHLFYDDLATGYLHSLNWTTAAGWVVDADYNTVASKWTNSARSAAAITFNYSVRTFQVYFTTATVIARIIWTQKTGWTNENLELVAAPNTINAINRDIAVVVWGSTSEEISVFYAAQVGTTGTWDIRELRYSAAKWTTPTHGSNFNNFNGTLGIGLAAVAWKASSHNSIRLYAQGDNYVELATDDLSSWTSRVLGNCTSEDVIRQGQISAVEWNYDNNKQQSIRYFQVKCLDAQCSAPVFQVNYYDSGTNYQWHTYDLVIKDEQ